MSYLAYLHFAGCKHIVLYTITYNANCPLITTFQALKGSLSLIIFSLKNQYFSTPLYVKIFQVYFEIVNTFVKTLNSIIFFWKTYFYIFKTELIKSTRFRSKLYLFGCRSNPSSGLLAFNWNRCSPCRVQWQPEIWGMFIQRMRVDLLFLSFLWRP